MLRKHLVIVGGGWAGLALVRALKKADPKKLRVTLISDDPNFRYSPGLYRVATGHKEREAILPIGEVIEDIEHIDFVLDKATAVDRKSRTITTESGAKFHYDFAVFALGMVTSYFGIPGIEEYSFSIKSTAGLRKFRSHLHKEIADDKALDKNYVVVGAGPTGVELAAALASYLKRTARWHKVRCSNVSITLVDAAPRVMPSMPESASNKVHRRLRSLGIKVLLNAKVQDETDTTLSVDGKSIPTHTVIWTAGVSNNPFYQENAGQFTFNDRGKVEVNENLMVGKHTYVIGDNAATPFSGLALTAVHNAHYVAKDILRQIGYHERKAYKPFSPAAVVPVGKRWAILKYRSVLVWGLPGAFLRSIADFVGYMDVLGFWKALEIWFTSDQQEEQCSVCRSQLIKQHSSAELLEA